MKVDPIKALSPGQNFGKCKVMDDDGRMENKSLVFTGGVLVACTYLLTYFHSIVNREIVICTQRIHTTST